MRALALTLTLTLTLTRGAWAGGFGRPNQIGARAIGMGGAFAAVADDPSAVWHDPAGLAFPDETQVMLSLELLRLDRVWTLPDGTVIRETTGNQAPCFAGVCPVPLLGASTRFAFGKQKPQRLAIGVAGYVSYGGQIAFDPAALKGAFGNAYGISSTGITLYELAPAVAYQVADALALGFALRVGVAAFSVNDTEAAFAASNLSASGAGIGATLSVMARPHERVNVAAVYRTQLSTSLSGSGDVAIGGGMPTRRDLSLAVAWPQSASLGVSVRPARFLRLVAQGDWTGWSSVQQLEVDFSGGLAQTRAMRFSDNVTLHLGGELTVSRFAVRLGAAYDSNAIPDSTTRRENRDGSKADVTVGAGVRVGPARIDAAFDWLFGLDAHGVNAPRVVMAGSPDVKAGTAEAGGYQANVFNFALSGTVAF